MFLKPIKIEPSSIVSDIVNKDFRTAEVFRKYGIEYCCGGKWSLEVAAMSKGISLDTLIEELEMSSRVLQLPNSLPFGQWNIVFLSEYIVHVHHFYLKKNLPEIKDLLIEFAADHHKKYPNLLDLEKVFRQIHRETIPHLQEEEDVIFPYIRQIVHAFDNHESYAGLLVKTLRKPVEKVMNHEHVIMKRMMERMRQVTNNYIPPPESCINHRVVYSKLRELDNDLAQHLHLEQDILFPKALQIERQLLISEAS